MTSMPASRSARAMIFAPRSCPSRPGLATTTRIFPATARSLRLLGVELLGAVRRKRPELGGEIGMPLEGSVGDRLHAHVSQSAAARARCHRTGDIPRRDPAMAGEARHAPHA